MKLRRSRFCFYFFSSAIFRIVSTTEKVSTKAGQAQDCDRIELRRRRQHDLRRSFITLARTDGARRDVLEVITHGPRGNIVDIYTTLPWPLLCEEVAKLRVQLLEGQVIQLPKTATASVSDGEHSVLGTVEVTHSPKRRKGQESLGHPGLIKLRGGRDLKTTLDASPSESTSGDAQALVENGRCGRTAHESSASEPLVHCTNVPNDPIGASLLDAAAEWSQTQDPSRLQAALLRILTSMLE